MDMFTIDVSVEGAVLPLIAKNLKKRKEKKTNTFIKNAKLIIEAYRNLTLVL